MRFFKEAIYGFKDFDEFREKSKKLGMKTLGDVKRMKQEPEHFTKGGKERSDIQTMRSYSKTANPKDLDLDEALGLNKDKQSKVCVVCNKEYKGYGNNAKPVAEGQCCDECNMKVVIPTRLEEDAKNIETRYDVVLIYADTYKGEKSYSYYDVFDNARYVRGKKYFANKESAIKQADRLYDENKDNEGKELNYVVRELKVKPMTRVSDKELDSKIIYNANKNSELQLTEDTIKTKDGKWTNKGDEGTHGTFKTKKAADAQRKAMFANGFKESVGSRKLTLEEVRQIALDNYENGGDVVMECWTDEDIMIWIDEHGTKEELLDLFSKYDDQYQDMRGSGEYCDIEANTNAKKIEAEDNIEIDYDEEDYGPSNPWDAPGMSIKDFLR